MRKLITISVFLYTLLFTGCSVTNFESGVISTITTKGKLLKQETFNKEPIVVAKNNKTYYCFEMNTGKYDCFNKSKALLYTAKDTNVYTVKRYEHLVEIYIPKKK